MADGNLVNFDADHVIGILEALDTLSGRAESKGLAEVIGNLTSYNEYGRRGAIGALLSGSQLAEQYPNARLVFEAPVYDDAGVLIRKIDISVREQQTTRVAGVTTTKEVEIASYEIKEISTTRLGDRAPQELARDIVRDSRLRASRPAPAAGSRPLFETFKWRVRRLDLQQTAMKRIGATSPMSPEVDAEMRRMLRGQLEKAFDRPEMNALL